MNIDGWVIGEGRQLHAEYFPNVKDCECMNVFQIIDVTTQMDQNSCLLSLNELIRRRK